MTFFFRHNSRISFEEDIIESKYELSTYKTRQIWKILFNTVSSNFVIFSIPKDQNCHDYIGNCQRLLSNNSIISICFLNCHILLMSPRIIT